MTFRVSITALFASALFSGWAAPASAASLLLGMCDGMIVPATELGDSTIVASCFQGGPDRTVSIEIFADFSDVVTIGGGFDFNYDTEHFEFESWSPVPIGDPDFQRLPDISPGLLSGIAFGEFFGVTGFLHVGTVELNLLVTTYFPNPGLLSLGPNQSGLTGPFVDAATFQPIATTYSQVRIVPFPAPAAGWLLISAVAAAAGATFRRNQG